MLSKAMSPIDWSECGQYVIDHVRGLIPWPVATAELDGKTFKIFRVEKTEKTTDKAPGTLLALTRRRLPAEAARYWSLPNCRQKAASAWQQAPTSTGIR